MNQEKRGGQEGPAEVAGVVRGNSPGSSESPGGSEEGAGSVGWKSPLPMPRLESTVPSAPNLSCFLLGFPVLLRPAWHPGFSAGWGWGDRTQPTLLGLCRGSSPLVLLQRS